MSGGTVNLNLNLNLRRDVEPLELLKQLAFSPLIYIRLAGIVSQTTMAKRSYSQFMIS